MLSLSPMEIKEKQVRKQTPDSVITAGIREGRGLEKTRMESATNLLWQ